MDQEKLKTVMNAFILPQFSYCPVIWMFHDRNVNNEINKIHERALRIAFKDTSSNFEELLIKAASVTIHQRNLQLLATEIHPNMILILNSWRQKVSMKELQMTHLYGERLRFCHCI